MTLPSLQSKPFAGVQFAVFVYFFTKKSFISLCIQFKVKTKLCGKTSQESRSRSLSDC